jgi:hypothetical protein
VGTVKLHEAFTKTFISVGHEVMAGAVLSLSVMVNEHELVLPAPSVAVNVISCEVLCPLNIVPATGDCVSVAPQLSETVAVYVGTVKLHEAFTKTFISVGHEVMAGAVLSLSVMVNEHELELPAPSVAVNVMSCEVLCPLNIVPATGDCVSVAPQLSETVAVYVGIVKLQEAFTKTFAFAGHEVMAGAMLSLSVIVNEHELVLPAPSVAVSVTSCCSCNRRLCERCSAVVGDRGCVRGDRKGTRGV